MRTAEFKKRYKVNFPDVLGRDAKRIFPNVESILRLMGAVLMDENEKWSQRRYMNLTEPKSWDEKSAPMGAEEERSSRVA